MVLTKVSMHSRRHQSQAQSELVRGSIASLKPSRFVHPPTRIVDNEDISEGSFLVCGKPIAEGIRIYNYVTGAVALLGLLCSSYLIHHHHFHCLMKNRVKTVFEIVLIVSSFWFTLSLFLLIPGVLNEGRRLLIAWIAAMAMLFVVWIGLLLYLIITSTIDTLIAVTVILLTTFFVHGIWVVINFLQWIQVKKMLPRNHARESLFSILSLSPRHHEPLQEPLQELPQEPLTEPLRSKHNSISSNSSKASTVSRHHHHHHHHHDHLPHIHMNHNEQTSDGGYKMVVNLH